MPTLEISNETFEKIKDQLGGDYEVMEIEDFEDLVGQTVTLWCVRYIYHGEVKSVNSSFVVLKDAGIVYETGDLDSKEPSDLQKLPGDCLVLLQSIESVIKLKW